MYPAKLYLKNFLSYGEQGTEIDFTGYKILLLIGKNGAGKSSILDAILWALWGKTRSGGDNDIMHSGSSDMEVRLDFIVRDAIYRVVRKRSKKGKSFVSVLELQSLTEPITILTDATIVQTQARLDELVGVDYELLVNSAFLRQGQSQEFTQKSPAKRKQLLATLLGLEKYADYHEAAKKNLRLNETELIQLERDISSTNQTLTQYEQEITQQKASLSEQDQTTLEIKMAESEEALRRLQIKSQLVAEWDQQLVTAKQKQQIYQSRINEIKTSSTALQQELVVLKAAIAEAPQTIDPQAWEKAEADFNQAQTIFQKHQDIAYRIQTLQKQIEKHNNDYAQQLQQLQTKLKQITDSDITTGDQQLLEATKIALSKKQQSLLELAQSIAKLEQQMQSIVDQGNQINKRKEAVTTMDDECPLCEQHIDQNHKHTILDKYTEEREALLATYQDHKQAHDQAVIDRKTTEQAISELTTTIQIQQTSLHEFEVKKTQQESLKQQIETLEQQQKSQSSLLETELASFTQQQSHLGFDTATWETMKIKRAEQQQAHIQAQKYQDARLKISELEQNYKFQLSSLSEVEANLTEVNVQIKNLEAQKPQPGDEANIVGLQQTLINLKKQYQYLLQLQVLITHREKEQSQLTEKLTKLAIQKNELSQQHGALELLVEALGNKGIPQMLIEESIPRLEHYANEVLSHLSDHTMSIRLSLTRPSKTDRDAQIETLDILIGDSVGTRAYELFSGGEAFRIDIAVRIALTKLLTEHTHGSIDFLVIDEGFGSQDDTGCDHIVQIIHQLEQYFHLMLIITHVDELKETFPDRLVIKKGPQGSEVFYDED